jgi:hypothetical protein
MLYIHYDPITEAMLPYFLGLVYLVIWNWLTSPGVKVASDESVRPERVLDFVEDLPRRKTSKRPVAKQTRRASSPSRAKNKVKAGV